jgi:hypothetical protein
VLVTSLYVCEQFCSHTFLESPVELVDTTQRAFAHTSKSWQTLWQAAMVRLPRHCPLLGHGDISGHFSGGCQLGLHLAGRLYTLRRRHVYMRTHSVAVAVVGVGAGMQDGTLSYDSMTHANTLPYEIVEPPRL